MKWDSDSQVLQSVSAVSAVINHENAAQELVLCYACVRSQPSNLLASPTPAHPHTVALALCGLLLCCCSLCVLSYQGGINHLHIPCVCMYVYNQEADRRTITRAQQHTAAGATFEGVFLGVRVLGAAAAASGMHAARGACFRGVPAHVIMMVLMRHMVFQTSWEGGTRGLPNRRSRP